jgi:hypothetical protein
MTKIWVTLLALVTSAAVALAQTPDMAALRHAAQEMSFLSSFFNVLMKDAPEAEVADNYRAMNEATQTFLRMAADPYPAEALRATQETYRRAKLPPPVSLAFVPVDAERRRDTRLSGGAVRRPCGGLWRGDSEHGG